MRLLSCLFALMFAGTAVAEPWKLDDQLKILKPEDVIDTKSTPAPQGAIILFDGKTTDAWTKKDGKSPVAWRIVDGAWEGVKGHGDIITKEKFDGTFQLHIEFRVPYEPAGKGQGRGNSGVYLQGRYEVQVLDSYGLKSGKNDCGALYDHFPPRVNACKAPTVWQAYDITFTAPRFKNGKKTEPARITVYQNGVKIHDNVAIPVDNTRAGMGGDPSQAGPILLQDHGHPVQYRNIWLLKK